MILVSAWRVGNANSEYPIKFTVAQQNSKDTFAGFDFDAIWQINSSKSPTLLFSIISTTPTPTPSNTKIATVSSTGKVTAKDLS